MEKKIFWAAFAILGLLADLILPFSFFWVLVGTLGAGIASWWIAYRSGWFY